MGASPQLLLIDADSAFVDQVAGWLGDLQLAVTTVPRFDEAIATLADTKPAIIIMSTDLEDGNGLDGVGRLRAKNAVSQVPVVVAIAASTTREEVEKHRASDEAATGYIEKPYSFLELADLLDELQLLPNYIPKEGPDTTPATTPQLAKLESDNNQLRAMLKKLKQSEMTLKNQLDTAVAEKEAELVQAKEHSAAAEKAAQSAKQQITDLQKRHQAVQETLKQLEDERDGLAEKVKTLQAQPKIDEAAWAKREAELEANHKKVQDSLRSFYKNKLEEAKGGADTDLQAKIEDLEKRLNTAILAKEAIEEALAHERAIRKKISETLTTD